MKRVAIVRKAIAVPGGIKRNLPYDKKGLIGAALCSLGKAGAQHKFLSLTF